MIWGCLWSDFPSRRRMHIILKQQPHHRIQRTKSGRAGKVIEDEMGWLCMRESTFLSKNSSAELTSVVVDIGDQSWRINNNNNKKPTNMWIYTRHTLWPENTWGPRMSGSDSSKTVSEEQSYSWCVPSVRMATPESKLKSHRCHLRLPGNREVQEEPN